MGDVINFPTSLQVLEPDVGGWLTLKATIPWVCERCQQQTYVLQGPSPMPKMCPGCCPHPVSWKVER